MKKRLLMILLVVALLVTAAVFAVQANNGTTQTSAVPEQCPCGCGLLANVVWTDLTPTNGALTANNDIAAGHYKIEGSGKSTTTITTDTYYQPASGKVVILVKNCTVQPTKDFARANASGKEMHVIGDQGKIEGTDGSQRVFRASGRGVLTINGDLEVRHSATAVTQNGSIADAYYNGKIIVNGGQIYGGNSSTSSKKNGGAFYVWTYESAAGTLEVNGGTIYGGANTNTGGAIQVDSGTFTMTAGTIYGADNTKGGAIYSKGSVSISGGTVYGAVASNRGGAICIEGGTLTVSGSADIIGTPKTGTASVRGGAISFGGSTFNMTGGTVRDGYATNGGNIMQVYGEVYITGGTIKDGKGTSGGNINVWDGEMSIKDTNGATVVSGGSASNGGNIYVNRDTQYSGYGECTIELTNNTSIISDGSAPKNGGNIYSANELTINKGTISGGSASEYGGAIYIGNGTFTMQDGTVTGGTATLNGGNIYLAGGTDHSISGGKVKDGTAANTGNIQANVDLDLSNCTISGGVASNGVAGQIMIYGGATVTMTSGTIDGSTRDGAAYTGMNATGRGGAIYMDGSTFDMQGGTIKGCASTDHGGVAAVMNSSTFQMSGDAEVILDSRTSLNHVAGIFTYNSTVNLSGNASIKGLGNKHSGTQGNALSLNGTPLTLSGNASVYDAGNTRRKNIAANSGLVTIAEGWSGTATIQFPAAAFTDGAVPGATIGTDYATAATFTGKLYAENVYVAAKDVTPQVLANNGQLQVAATYIQDAPNFDGITWYLNNAAAVAAYEEGDVIRLITTETLDLDGKTVYVDFGGLTVNVTGNGTLYGIDTATGFTGDAAATATGATAEPFAVDPLFGTIYVAKDGHFYPIQIKNDGYGVVSTNMGIYFNALIQCNPAIQSCIVGYGIDATLDDSFVADNYLSGSVTDSYPAGGAFYGYISGIMGAGVGNDAETGATPIRTRLWIKLSNGEAEYTVYAADRAKSFKDVMQAINTGWASLTTSHETVLDMYKNYYTVMNTWGLTTIDDAYEALN